MLPISLPNDYKEVAGGGGETKDNIAKVGEETEEEN